ncbi:MAG: hypothetical protein HW421_2266 [Ignavibacteria bacterium]|nr:hypothetical protein [Ignavibacteria bacterium]
MKYRLFLIAAAFFLLLPLSSVFSQGTTLEDDPLNPRAKPTPVYIGPVVGYNRTFHTYNDALPTFSNDILCPKFPNSTANGFYAGGSFEYLLGDLARSNSSIIARVLYNTMPMNTTQLELSALPSLVEDPTDPLKYSKVDSRTRHDFEVNYQMVTAEVIYKLNLFETNLGVTIGPTFDIPIVKKSYQTYKLIEPDNVQFIEKPDVKYSADKRTIIVQDATITNSSGFRFGVKAGIQYEFITSKRMYIVPNINYNFAVTKVTNDLDWRINALQIGVDVRFAISAVTLGL